MRKSLDRLYTAALDCFSHLCITNPADKEEWDTERRGYQQALDAYRNSYTALDSDPFANVSWALTQMGIQPNDPLLPRVSQVLCMANLASALDAITDIDPGLQFANIQALVSTFPQDFNAINTHGDGTMDPEDIIDHVLSLRTQLVIIALRQYVFEDPQDPFNPYHIVGEVFFRPNVSIEEIVGLRNDPGNDQSEILKEVPGLTEMPHWGYEKIFTRIRSLCSQLPDRPVLGRELQLKDLETTFPFEQSILELQQFIKKTFVETRSLLQPGAAPPPEYIEASDAEIQSQLAETLSQFSSHENARYVVH